MQSQDAGPRPPSPVDLEQAEAAFVEHYPRLTRLAYLVLSPDLGRGRRALLAHGLTQRALPRGRAATGLAALPAQRRGQTDPAYAYVRLRVLRAALATPRRRMPQLPPALPLVWGLRLFPRVAGHDELALDRQLGHLSAPGRAAFALRGLEGLSEAETGALLAEAGAPAVRRALAEAARVTVPGVRGAFALLASPGFDPCSLRAGPTDVLRRRRHLRAALAGAAALLACGALLGLPGDGHEPGPYHPSTQAALDPAKLLRAHPGAWRKATRADFSRWPPRGELAQDQGLLGRALAAWAQPGRAVLVRATAGTPTGGPPGPPRLLFAGRLAGASVVLLHDGLRLARYAEPAAGRGGAALDLARADGATAGEAGAVVLGRPDGDVRFLTAPWVRHVRVRDLRSPATGARPLPRSDQGVTAPVPRPAPGCRTWSALELRDATTGERHLLTDLGELTPARLTHGDPAGPGRAADTSVTRQALNSWAATACSLAEFRAHGVRSVNAWRYARQRLPESGGTAAWFCTRAETWRGTGSRVVAQFHGADRPAGAVVARAEESAACGPREPRVLAGVRWKSAAGTWYLLAAGSADVGSVSAGGGTEGSAEGNTLALRTARGERARIAGVLKDGGRIGVLR